MKTIPVLEATSGSSLSLPVKGEENPDRIDDGFRRDQEKLLQIILYSIANMPNLNLRNYKEVRKALCTMKGADWHSFKGDVGDVLSRRSEMKKTRGNNCM